MTSNLSSCCQISERKKETASGRDRERSVMIEIVVGWILSFLYVTFFQSGVFSRPPWGESKILPSPQSPTQWVRGQPAGSQIFIPPFLSPFTSFYISHPLLLCWTPVTVSSFPSKVRLTRSHNTGVMVRFTSDAFTVNSQVEAHTKKMENVFSNNGGELNGSQHLFTTSVFIYQK